MLDFGALPPEVNSARMYSGAGAGPMLSAASAWSSLAGDLESSAAETRTLVSGLDTAWQGPTAEAMNDKMAQHVSWLTNTAAVASHTAAQANAAAAAYETAFSATVNPAVVAANRTELATLVATNLLGQNTPAIMASEAEYSEMWAQDAAAMYSYTTQSAAATQLQPFSAAGSGTTTFDSIFGESFPQFLEETFQSFVSSGPYNIPIELLSMFNVLWAVSSGAGNPIGNALNKVHNDIEVPATQTPRPVIPKPRPASAGVGAGERVGGLRVPPSWASAAANPETPEAAPFTPYGATEEGAPLGVVPLGGSGTGSTRDGDRQQQPKYRGYKVQVLPN